MTNKKLLEDKIRQSGLKKGFLAQEIGVSRSTFCALLNNKSEFKANQIRKLCDLLDIKDDKTLRAIFFTPDGAF